MMLSKPATSGLIYNAILSIIIRISNNDEIEFYELILNNISFILFTV